MKLNFKFEWWKLLFILLETIPLVVLCIFFGFIGFILGYLFVGFLICVISSFIYPRILLTWFFELWKDDICEPFIRL